MRLACGLLKTSPRAVQQMLTLWKPYLVPLVPLFDALLLPTNVKAEQADLKRRIAKAVGITYRQVNRLIKTMNIDVPKPKSSIYRAEKHKSAQNMRILRRKHAIDVISGSNSVDEAAEGAELSPRHMYRLVNQLAGLCGVTYKDLRYTTTQQRRKLAASIEEIVENQEEGA